MDNEVEFRNCCGLINMVFMPHKLEFIFSDDLHIWKAFHSFSFVRDFEVVFLDLKYIITTSIKERGFH